MNDQPQPFSKRPFNEKTGRLWCLTIKVRPALSHPAYWELGFAFLQIFLFAQSDDDARVRAWTILEQLPYEVVGAHTHIGAYDPKDLRAATAHRHREQIDYALWHGVALRLSVLPMGADSSKLEQFFEDQPTGPTT